jgi:hypothetical protein
VTSKDRWLFTADTLRRAEVAFAYLGDVLQGLRWAVSRGVLRGVAGGWHLACSVEERGKDGVDLVGGQQGSSVAKAG